MKNEYTITKGRLACGVESIEIPFALVFNQDGIFTIETFLPSAAFFEQTKQTGYYTLAGKTEKNYEIEITALAIQRFSYEYLKIELTCYGALKLTNNKKEKPVDIHSANRDDIIYAVEVEGLKMTFAHHTQIEKYRDSGKVDEFLNFEFDHTTCAMIINFAQYEVNYFNVIFSRNLKTNNIIIDFSQTKGYSELSYRNYLLIKDVLISFLSFINGGQVTVRKELTGWFVTSGGKEYTDSQTVYIYSEKKREVVNLSHFLPINENHSYTSKIIPSLFVKSFDLYFELNKHLDFTSLVFSLNNATETMGLEEKYFILITALEKICSKYAKYIHPAKKSLIDSTLFTDSIRPALDAVLKKYESLIKNNNAAAWPVFKSKLGNLNKSNNAETAQKLYELFAYAKITMNSEVESLIETERNQAVHEGVIGHTEDDRIKNYWKLDHILRDIILNLINYQGMRNHIFKYYEQK